MLLLIGTQRKKRIRGINVGKVKEFTGEKIGLLQVLSLEKERKNGYAVWKCLCDCGNVCYKKSCYLKRYPSCGYRDWETDRKSTRLNSSHSAKSRMPSSA